MGRTTVYRDYFRAHPYLLEDRAPPGREQPMSSSAVPSVPSAPLLGDHSTPQLSWREPSEHVVRIQLFAIMMHTHLSAADAWHSKSKFARKRRLHSVPSKYQCFETGHELLKNDPILRFALHTSPETDQKIMHYASKIVDFAFFHCKHNMPPYMREAFQQLPTSLSHTLQIAAIYFYAAWHVDWDPITDQCSVVEFPCGDDASINFFHELGFHQNAAALKQVAKAVWEFERGQGVSTVFGFVHTLVSNWWIATAQTPARRRKRHCRLRSSAAAASASNSSSSDESVSSTITQSSESVSDAHHSESSASEDSSSDSPSIQRTICATEISSVKASRIQDGSTGAPELAAIGTPHVSAH